MQTKVVTYCSSACQKKDWPKHKPSCEKMTSAQRRCKKHSIIQEFTNQTKTATAAVAQELKSQIASLNCKESVVLACVRPSQVWRAYEMLTLPEQFDSQCAIDSGALAAGGGGGTGGVLVVRGSAHTGANGAACGAAGGAAGGGAGGGAGGAAGGFFLHKL